MTKNIFLPLLFFITSITTLLAQKVPSSMEFAGIHLKITEGAKRDIQKDVDMLVRSPKHHNIKVDRARLYFPIIERKFRELNVPTDFKYLSLQESALISDAVSSSNAVGFWQFKKATAVSMGLRVDGVIDERKNIVSASRGAAKYLKRNNTLYFNNWLYTLQAYLMGEGGMMRVMDKSKIGANRMTINKKTHWYVKRFLAHKIAFEGSLNSNYLSENRLAEYTNTSNKTLKELSKKLGYDLEKLKDYNKWIKKGKIPSDKTYTVIIPVNQQSDSKLLALINDTNGAVTAKNNQATASAKKIAKAPLGKEVTIDAGADYPEVKRKTYEKKGIKYQLINGIPGMVVSNSNSATSIANKAGITLEKFKAYNDMKPFDKIQNGQVYYFKKKKKKAKIHFYVAKSGESMWEISQKFGLRLKKLLMKNRMDRAVDLKPGRVLWLRFIRPDDVEVQYKNVPTLEQGEKEPAVVSTPTTQIRQRGIITESVADDTIFEFEDTTSESKKISVPKSNTHNGKEASKLPEKEPIKIIKNKELQNVIDRKNPTPVDAFNIDEKVKFIEIAAPSATKKEGQLVHTITQGETLYSIARTYKVSVSEIREWNNLTKNDTIKFDQTLIVAANSTASPSKVTRFSNNKKTITHTVQEGETLYSIARKYAMSVAALKKLNKIEGNTINIGSEIKIYFKN